MRSSGKRHAWSSPRQSKLSQSGWMRTFWHGFENGRVTKRTSMPYCEPTWMRISRQGNGVERPRWTVSVCGHGEDNRSRNVLRPSEPTSLNTANRRNLPMRWKQMAVVNARQFSTWSGRSCPGEGITPAPAKPEVLRSTAQINRRNAAASILEPEQT